MSTTTLVVLKSERVRYVWVITTCFKCSLSSIKVDPMTFQKYKISVISVYLPFNNPSAPNVSDWVELTRLPSFTVMRGDQALSREQIEREEGLKDGACGRVVVSHYSVTRGGGVLEVRRHINKKSNISTLLNLAPPDVNGELGRAH